MLAVSAASTNGCLCGAVHAEGDVFAHGFAEQIGILRHEADRAAQLGKRPIADGASVDQQRAWRRLPEARHQRRERALAAAGGADDGQS